jgi:hypothetical protein
MIDEVRGRIEYDESGTGPTIVLVPGSCSTRAAWRNATAVWNGPALGHRQHTPFSSRCSVSAGLKLPTRFHRDGDRRIAPM